MHLNVLAVSHHPEEKILEFAVMREVGMGLDQSSPKSALVINNVALFVALTVFKALQASDCHVIRFLT